MNNINAIVDGILANDVRFFGSNTAEIVSLANITNGGWNGDYAYSVRQANPWAAMGGVANLSSRVGIFAFSYDSGATFERDGHRTILLGY